MDTVLTCLATDSVGRGEYTEKFEKSAKELFGFEAAIPIRSPYLAIQVLLSQLGLSAGDKIAISALAPFYHRSAIENAGYYPLYTDVDPDTGAPIIKSEVISSAKAVILFDALGSLARREDLDSVGIPIVEDMTQALGAHRRADFAGTFGDFSIYGMEYGSLIAAGGGALLYASRKREATIIKNLAEKIPEEVVLTDYNAALALAQTRDFEKVHAFRKTAYEFFKSELVRSRHKTLVEEEDSERGYWAFPVILETGMKDAQIYARKNGVEAEPAFDKSIISMEDFPLESCPGARSLWKRCLLFPLHSKMGQDQTKAIGRVLATLP